MSMPAVTNPTPDPGLTVCPEGPEMSRDALPTIEHDWIKHRATVGAADLTLNLAQIELMDSACLGQLITLHRNVQEAGGTLYIDEAHGCVAELFRVTSLDKLFAIRP